MVKLEVFRGRIVSYIDRKVQIVQQVPLCRKVSALSELLHVGCYDIRDVVLLMHSQTTIRIPLIPDTQMI